MDNNFDSDKFIADTLTKDLQDKVNEEIMKELFSNKYTYLNQFNSTSCSIDNVEDFVCEILSKTATVILYNKHCTRDLSAAIQKLENEGIRNQIYFVGIAHCPIDEMYIIKDENLKKTIIKNFRSKHRKE